MIVALQVAMTCHLSRIGGLLALAAVLNFAHSVSAAERAVPASDLTLLGTTGATVPKRATTDVDGLAQLELGGLLRGGIFTLGVVGEHKTTIVFNWFGLYGAAGSAFFLDRLRIDLFGIIGMHRYSDWGRDIFWGSDPGAAATLPCIGGRLRAIYSFGPDPPLSIGISVGYDQDWWNRRVDYTYVNHSFFGDSKTVNAHQSIGADFLSIGFAFTRTIEL